MKIAIVIWKMAFSGAENVANALAEQFQMKGHEVNIILTASEEIQNGKYKTYTLITPARNKIERIIKRSLKLRRIVKNEDYDVIVGFGHIDTIHMLRALAFTRTCMIGCARMDPVHYPISKKLRIERNIMYRGLSGMIVQSSGQKEFFDKIVKNRCIVIPNPVRNIPANVTPVEQRKKRIVTVARLDNAQKNHLFMFECFSDFVKTHGEYTLELYGDGPDRKLYENYIKKLKLEDQIILHGRVSNPNEMISDAEMFLLTSIHEGMPNALIEAMSLALPVISTDCGGGGARDLIHDGVNGFLVNLKDKETFVSRMNAVSDDLKLRKKLSENAYKIREVLDVKQIAERWLEAFERIKKETSEKSSLN